MTKGLGLEAVIKDFVTFPLDERGKHSISLFLSLKAVTLNQCNQCDSLQKKAAPGCPQ